MKISEAKNGKVRYTESKVASGGTKLKESMGLSRLQRDNPDFMEYLSEKDRRRWDRLSDARKERILTKARNNATVREQAQMASLQGNAENRTSGGRINTSAETRINSASGAGASERASDSNRNSRRIDGSREPSNIRQTSNVVSVSESRTTGPASSQRGNHVNGSSSGGGGFIGLAVSAAKKTANKVSKSLKARAEQFSGGEGSNAEAAEKATDEVKNVTNPIKKTVGGLFALLAVVIGPFFFVILLIILLIVVIIFLVAWVISILVPAATQGHGDFTVSGMMPYYCQQDERWGSYPYDAGTIYSYGCGPTSMAMILACLTGDFSIIPTTTAEYGNQNIGVYGLSVNGTHAAPENLAALYNISGIEQMAGPHQNCCGVPTAFNMDYIKQKIAEGCPILVSVTGSYVDVSTDGHYFVLYGQGENGVYLYDPATLGRLYQESIENDGTDWNSCLNSAKHIWIFPAPQLRVEGDSNAEKIFNCLVSAGWSKASAAAAVGNFYQEAGGGGTADINPASYDSGSWGEAGGIAGFTDNGEAGNFTALKNFAAQKGKNWTDLQTQCEFLIYQMSHGTWWGAYNTPTCVEMNEQGYTVQHVSYEEFIRMTDVNEATKAFLCFYEDCGYAMAHYEDVRLPMALQAYEAWGS